MCGAAIYFGNSGVNDFMLTHLLLVPQHATRYGLCVRFVGGFHCKCTRDEVTPPAHKVDRKHITILLPCEDPEGVRALCFVLCALCISCAP